MPNAYGTLDTHSNKPRHGILTDYRLKLSFELTHYDTERNNFWSCGCQISITA